MDFGNFGDPRVNQQNSNQSGQQGNQNSDQLRGNQPQATTTDSSTRRDSEAVFMHTMEHTGVFCDACEGNIRGFRYKCLQCPDFDLCCGCERKGHHPGHVMMRIAFPEQTRDAIRRFCNNSPTGSPPRSHMFPEELFGLHHRGSYHNHHHRFRRGCNQGRQESGGMGPQESPKKVDGENEDPRLDGCPYGLGKKEMKKWAKCMKKMAYQQKKSAETYSKSSAQSSAQASGGEASTASGVPSQFDFTAAASQIQEFLNAFGIPIDVVELYDNFGNHGRPSGDGTGASAENKETTTGVTTDQPGTAGIVPTETPGEQQTPTPEEIAAATSYAQQAALAAHLQQLHLNASTNRTVTFAADTTGLNGEKNTPSVNQSMGAPMEHDADPLGWTLLENERNISGSNSPRNEPAVTITPNSTETVVAAPFFDGSFEASSLNSNLSPNTATISAGTGPSIISPTLSVAQPTVSQPGITTPSAGASLYPMLSPPQLQQLLSGVSNAVNSVVRNIPIMTNPSGPTNGSTSLGESQIGIESGPPSLQGMDSRCHSTLNQLLAMGFSNHDGWLSRLVIAKKGDLEAVLNALFPNNGA